MLTILAIAFFALSGVSATPASAPTNVTIRSRAFAYVTRADGASARTWRNLLAGASLDLGGCPEVEITTGSAPESGQKVELRQAAPPDVDMSESRATLHVRSADGRLRVDILLRADLKWPLLHKTVEVTNLGREPVRILDVVLGRLPAGSARTEGGERGFPLYLDGHSFVTLAHPAGYAHVEDRDAVLRQYPGTMLQPNGVFRTMEAIYGVAEAGRARKLFVDYVRSRMVRITAGHDKPYAILDSFGGQEEGEFKHDFSLGVAESYLRGHLQAVGESRKQNGVQFDYYCLEFWQDRAGDLFTFNRRNFPNGFGATRDAIQALGMQPALWIDSGGLPEWSIDLNPAVKGCFTHADGSGELCRASEPINRIYTDAFLRQMRDNHAGLFKFDNLGPGGKAPTCTNPAHGHLPGPLYSTEAIDNSVIDFISALRRVNPRVFIMLYWGYRSPWWLLYGDTYFESGDPIEGASPAQYPTPFARDAVTQRLDQAQLRIVDTPWLGKDSLGVWLSDWPWNSGIGKARWQEGVIMDMGRGGLLFQLWTDAGWLTPPEREQVATFIGLMKANVDCFRNTRFILGNPNNAEPYGYACADGRKAFLAVNNARLADSTVALRLGPECGLPDGGRWDVYRWYPRPARLTGIGADFASQLNVTMRPYEVDLLEIVPAGAEPSLGRHFTSEPAGRPFAERSLALPLAVSAKPSAPLPQGHWLMLRPSSAASANGATLSIRADDSVLASGGNPSNDTYTVAIDSGGRSISAIVVEALTDDSLPAHGPGRAVNGNLALTNVRIRAAPRDRPEQEQEIKLRLATADYSQTSYSGWPASAAIDADLRTGWSVFPEVGQSHAILIEFDKPVAFAAGTKLSITLAMGENGHSLGRFRIRATSDAAPRLPPEYQPSIVKWTGALPATRAGGLLFITGGNRGSAPHVSVGGRPVVLTPVWSAESNWDCPWIAWRVEIEPFGLGRAIAIETTGRGDGAGVRLQAYFLPR